MVAAHAIDGNFYGHLVGAVCGISQQGAAAIALNPGECRPESASIEMTVCKDLQPMTKKKRRDAGNYVAPLSSYSKIRRRLLVVLGLEYFTATVEAVRADVVTQVRFTGGWLDTQLRRDQEVVRAVHTALGWGLLILLNCHDDS
jgi:hypothetical protein